MRMSPRTMVSVVIIGLFFGASNVPTICSDISGAFDSRNILSVGGSGPGNYSTIQSAIDAASSGDTVFVYNGTYYENVIVNKTIDLIGENRASVIIDGSGNTNVIYVTIDKVTISGFTTQNGNYGIYLYHSNNNYITNNNANSNNDAGIYLSAYSNNNTVTGNTANSNNVSGIVLFRSSNNTVTGNTANSNNYSGIDLTYDCNNNTVTGNTANSNYYYGFYLVSFSNNTVTGNTASNNDYGIYFLYYSNNNTVMGNTVNSNNYYGIYLDSYSNNNTVTGNIASNNINGIYLDTSNNNIISSNYVSNSYWGITLGSSNNNTISSNNASNNDDGIHIWGYSSNNTITNNTANLNNNWGISLDSSSSNTITNNILLNNEFGIFMYSSSNNIINNNNVSNNQMAIWSISSCNSSITCNNVYSNTQWGIRLGVSSNSNTITSNNVSDNQVGIHLSSSINNTVSSNKASNNLNGICLENTSNNLIFNNYFNNPTNVYNNGSNQWNVSKTLGQNIIGGPYLGGNYWSDYSGVDTDGDGLGNTNIPYGPGDYLPLTPFLDINQNTFNRGFPIRHALDGDWAAAQSFIPTLNYFAKAEIYLRKFGTPEFNLTVELRENHPQGTLIDTLIFTPAEVPSSWSWFQLSFDDTLITPGASYFIICPPAPGGVTTSFGYEWGYAFGNQYDDGAFWFTRDGGDLWRDLPTMYEFCFRTYGY